MTGSASRLLSHVTEAARHAARLSTVSEETTALLNVVAEDRLDIGQLDIARSFLDRAFEVAVRNLGPDHPLTLETRGNLARFEGEAGRVDEAVSQLQALLEDERRVLAAEHPLVLKTRRSLARWLGEAGRTEEV